MINDREASRPINNWPINKMFSCSVQPIPQFIFKYCADKCYSNSPIPCWQNLSGVSKIKDNYNPATWMLDITSTTAEQHLGVDFAQIYKDSPLYQ